MRLAFNGHLNRFILYHNKVEFGRKKHNGRGNFWVLGRRYDAADQVTRVVDRNARKKDFTYNDLGLVTQEAWVDGFGNVVKTITHGYDDAGRETSISDGVTAYQYQYDLANRVTQIDNAGGLVPEVTLGMDYDFEGNRTWMSDSLGGSVSYAWQNQRLQSIAMTTADSRLAQVDLSYDSVGRLASFYAPDGR